MGRRAIEQVSLLTYERDGRGQFYPVVRPEADVVAEAAILRARLLPKPMVIKPVDVQGFPVLDKVRRAVMNDQARWAPGFALDVSPKEALIARERQRAERKARKLREALMEDAAIVTRRVVRRAHRLTPEDV